MEQEYEQKKQQSNNKQYRGSNNVIFEMSQDEGGDSQYKNENISILDNNQNEDQESNEDVINEEELLEYKDEVGVTSHHQKIEIGGKSPIKQSELMNVQNDNNDESDSSSGGDHEEDSNISEIVKDFFMQTHGDRGGSFDLLQKTKQREEEKDES